MSLAEEDTRPKSLPAGFLEAIAGIPVLADPVSVKRRSRDYFWYSPILNEQLQGRFADLIVVPRDEADVVKIAAACARYKVPVTPRGGGTGNYGQAVPLEGGIVIDLTAMTRVSEIAPGCVRVEAGAITFVHRGGGSLNFSVHLHVVARRRGVALRDRRSDARVRRDARPDEDRPCGGDPSRHAARCEGHRARGRCSP